MIAISILQKHSDRCSVPHCTYPVTAKGTGPQGRSRRGRDSTHRRPCGTSPSPATLCDCSAQGSKSWHSGSFAKYSDIGIVTISFPACCVSHRATGLPVMVHDMHTRRRRPDYLQACPMSHRSQVRIDFDPVALCGPVALYLLQWPYIPK